MRQTKRTVVILILILILSSALPSEAYADTSGTQVITVSIPCTVTLLIGDHGTVQVNGKSYTGDISIQAPVGTALTYTFIPDTGYRLSTLTYGGVTVIGSVKNGVYDAPPLTGHVVLKATFVKQAIPPGPPSPRTGDKSGFGFWLALMLASGTGLIALLEKRKNRRRT